MPRRIVFSLQRRFGRWDRALFVGGLLAATGGCLSLGGKTTYVHEAPITESRLLGLETRVSALEQAVVSRSTPLPSHEHLPSDEPLQSYETVEPAFGQAPPASQPPPYNWVDPVRGQPQQPVNAMKE
jgi:hypothetical protein